jgi:TonB family protein
MQSHSDFKSAQVKSPMKSCPTCNRTFSDETLSFCLVDGAILSAPFDPHATLIIPEPRQTEPPPTEVLKLEETKQEIPPTVASLQPEQKPEELVSTIAFPTPEVELPRPSPPTVLNTPKQNAKELKRTKVLLGIGVATIFLFVGAYSLVKNRNQSGIESANTNTAITNATKTTNSESVLNTNNSSRSSLPNTTTVDYTRVFSPEEVDQQARILSKLEATYTEEASKNKITGIVVLRVVLTADGEVIEISARKGLPYGLTEKAMAAARQIKFTPAVKDGQLVSQYMLIEYNFNLY